MAVNKVIYNDTTLIDLTEDTIIGESLMTDSVVLGADGNKVISADPVLVIQKNSRIADMYIHNAIGHVEGETLVLLKKSSTSDSEIEQDSNNNDNGEENYGDN